MMHPCRVYLLHSETKPDDETNVKRRQGENTISLDYMPFCPLPSALQIGREIKKRVNEILGIREAEARVSKHVIRNEINKTLQGREDDSEKENLSVPKMWFQIRH